MGGGCGGFDAYMMYYTGRSRVEGEWCAFWGRIYELLTIYTRVECYRYTLAHTRTHNQRLHTLVVKDYWILNGVENKFVYRVLFSPSPFRSFRYGVLLAFSACLRQTKASGATQKNCDGLVKSLTAVCQIRDKTCALPPMLRVNVKFLQHTGIAPMIFPGNRCKHI